MREGVGKSQEWFEVQKGVVIKSQKVTGARERRGSLPGQGNQDGWPSMKKAKLEDSQQRRLKFPSDTVSSERPTGKGTKEYGATQKKKLRGDRQMVKTPGTQKG